MTFRNLSVVIGAALSVSGCVSTSGWEAPAFAALQMPADVTLTVSSVHESVDNSGSLLIVDVLVYNEDDGMPMDNIQVEVMSNWYGAYLIPQWAVKQVDYPGAPDYSDCDSDGDGMIDADAPDECAWVWDVESSTYVEFAVDIAEGYQPTYLVAPTDHRGLLRVYVYIDSMPATVDTSTGEESSTSYSDIAISASIGHDSGAMLISTSE